MARPKKPNEVETIITSLGSAVPNPEDVILPIDNYKPLQVATSSSIVGKEISINLKANTYFGVGPIWLTPENYWCVVPEGLSRDHYDTIAKSIQNGTIVLGKVFLPPVEKASNILDKYWLAIERNGFDNKKTKTDFSMLIKRGSDSGWTALEIVNYCLEKENAGRRRKEVIRLLEQVIKNYDGPLRLYDPPDNAQGIKKVTITPDGVMTATTNSGTEIAKPVAEPAPPKDIVKGTKSASQVVNEMFS
jgi:hypothetical protein